MRPSIPKERVELCMVPYKGADVKVARIYIEEPLYLEDYKRIRSELDAGAKYVGQVCDVILVNGDQFVRMTCGDVRILTFSQYHELLAKTKYTTEALDEFTNDTYSKYLNDKEEKRIAYHEQMTNIPLFDICDNRTNMTPREKEIYKKAMKALDALVKVSWDWQ